MLRAAIWMVHHLGDQAAANRIEAALHQALEAGAKPVGLGGTQDVVGMGDEILARL